MPTTIEVVHKYFNDKVVFCGYSIQSLNRVRYTTGTDCRVTCLKCIALMRKKTTGAVLVRRKEQRFTKLHLVRRRGKEGKPRFLAWCGKPVRNENLERKDLKICRVCLRNKKGNQ